MIDFSKMAEGKGYTDEEVKEMNVDLSPLRWIIKMNSSSWNPESRDKTYLLEVKSTTHYPNQKVLGIRAYFPERHANSYITIVPPFEIPSYYDNPKNPTGQGDMFLNKGVVRNVGVLRKLSVMALGNNFRYQLYVRIKDNKNEEKDVFISFLDFQGWKLKSWINPNLDIDLKNREDRKKISPDYPDEYPNIKLLGFIIQRSDPEITGNFAAMIKEVSLEYDEAIIQTGQTEDNQEQIFGIYTEELIKRAKAEMWNVDRRIFLEWEEAKKQDAGSKIDINSRIKLPSTTAPSTNPTSTPTTTPKTN